MNPTLAQIINALWYFGPLSANQIRARLLMRGEDLAANEIAKALYTEYHTNLQSAKVKPILDQGQACPSVIAAENVVYRLTYNPLLGAPSGERRYHPEWKGLGEERRYRVGTGSRLVSGQMG
jgi:hypothetical protein